MLAEVKFQIIYQVFIMLFGANQGSDKSLQIDDLTPNHDDDT
jgi:hypothetical protein